MSEVTQKVYGLKLSSLTAFLLLFSFVDRIDTLLAMRLHQLHGSLGRPDGVDAHGAPGFLVDVIKGDCLAMEGGLLLGRALVLRHVIRRDKVGAGCAACVTMRAVFLDKIEEYYALVEGFS